MAANSESLYTRGGNSPRITSSCVRVCSQNFEHVQIICSLLARLPVEYKRMRCAHGRFTRSERMRVVNSRRVSRSCTRIRYSPQLSGE